MGLEDKDALRDDQLELEAPTELTRWLVRRLSICFEYT